MQIPSNDSYRALIRTNSQGLKIPKTCTFLIKSMQHHATSHKKSSGTKTNESESENGKRKSEKWARFKRNFIPRKMGTILNCVFGKQKSGDPRILNLDSMKENILESENDDFGVKKHKGVCDSKIFEDFEKGGVKLRRVRSVKNREMKKQSEEKLKTGERMRNGRKGKKRGGGEELCKKRILMGGKCRALNVSGVLHYDKNGVLLPEDIGS